MDASSKITAANQQKWIMVSLEEVKIDFPDEVVIGPSINDFLLALYYPDLLDKRMLEAMISSRWRYENRQDNPIGGHFIGNGES